MQMVSAAFSHLSDKLRAGEVAAEVVQKLSQLVSDLANRNFNGASSIQTVSGHSLPVPVLSSIDLYHLQRSVCLCQGSSPVLPCLVLSLPLSDLNMIGP